jgi:hypothetical protein
VGTFLTLDGIDPVGFVVLLVAFVAVVLCGILATGRRRVRTASLAERFGTEYGRAVEGSRSRRRAEAALSDRIERRAGRDTPVLEPMARAGFRARLAQLQEGFVDGPAFAARAALELVMEAAVARGYTNTGLEACLDDVSVDHPELVADLRRSLAAAEEWATTEHHRECFVHARALFQRIVAEGERPGDVDGQGDLPDRTHAAEHVTAGVAEVAEPAAD